MGLWREQTDLRAAAHACGYRDSFYPHEVEAMVATAAACSAELDLDTLRCGGYRDPDALSERARAALAELHTRTKLDHREFATGKRLTELYGGTRDMTRNDGLNWPHCDGLIWPHLRPIGGRRFDAHRARAEGGERDGVEDGAVRADQEGPRS
jgi:hypothetical protein